MTTLSKFIFAVCLSFCSLISQAQVNQAIVNEGPQGPTLIATAIYLGEVPSIASQIEAGTFKPAEDIIKEVNPKRWGANTSVPGKGLPKGDDPLWQNQMMASKSIGKAPSLTFEAASASATPTDPTGAVGPNHFVNSWNSSFRIWDKAGNPLIAAASLGTILPGTMGDPIVLYDKFADRFLITEFYSNGFDVAISKGSNPVTSGWYVYRFPTSSFPDYPKFSVWSDGYYITANKDQSTPTTSQVVFAIERNKMLVGNTAAQMVGFPLAGIVNSGFYSPLGFNANGPTLPPAGNAPIVYMQDDAWSGVTTDHLKIWSINVNWTTPASSTISSPQVINTQPFDGLFDAGSFSNLPQPSGSDIDALQATIMYMAQYRRFPTYNSAVFNFVVDLNGADNYAGIRWYELRQTTDGAPWTIYQEGTYSQPNGHSAFSGNMCMDANGNIALAYTTVSTTQYPSLRYTGRYAADPLGTMTFSEQVIVNGAQVDPSSRYGDYSQMTIDPTDDVTFWSIGEYFAGGTRKNQVGVFNFAPPALTAQFSGTPTAVCTGATVTFTNQSLGSPTSWIWSFPGGSPSSYNGQNPPAITYSTQGSYDVILNVSDGSGNNTLTKTGYITVKNLIAEFTGVPTTVVVGNTVSFTDNSSCNPTAWNWSFPGGTPSTSTAQSPTITYSTTGSYDVTLTITKPGGTDTKTKTGYVTVSPPVFNMTNGSVTTCTGDFYDSGGSAGSYQNGETYIETFYPSTPGSMMRVSFTSFSTELNYDTLTIYNGANSSSPLIGKYHGTTSPGIITASNISGALTFRFHSDGSVTSTGWAATIGCQSTTVPPVAQFTASTTTPAVNSTVIFTDQSTNIPTSWAWSFSPNTVVYAGGTSASSQNPQVKFSAAGSYSVSLTATNAYGSDPEIKTNYINVVNCTVSSFPWTEGFENAGVIPNCWTQELVGTSTLYWTFIAGNGGSYPAAAHGGTYNACLKDATDADNKTKVISPSINLSSLGSPVLKFWHTQAVWAGDQDQLIVYYRTSSTGAWTSLATYTANITTWTEETISLPAASSTYYIAFEGNAKYGYGVCIDDVSITGTTSNPTLSVTPSNQAVSAAAGTTPFTVTSNSAWTVSSNQTWCTVTPSGSGNGTITATYTENTTTSSRVANVTATVTGLTPIVVTVTQAGAIPTLTVTPPDQAVTPAAGNTSFTVTSNTNWTALSNQTWCTVTPSGSGSGTITATYTENTTYVSRVASITVTVSGLTPIIVTVTQAAAPLPEFNYTINNDVQTSDRTLEFDLYLLDMLPSLPFELFLAQAGILVSNSIIAGGTISVSIVPGSSGLLPAQVPPSITWTTAISNGCIKLSGAGATGCGAGTILSTTSPGTRVCRIRITNTVPFTASSQANLTFNFTAIPYPTKVFQYVTVTPCSNSQLTTSSLNCFNNSSNVVLNGPPSLSVSPSDQPVSASAGSIPFGVSSNASWTAVSNQTWCTVTPSGFGSGTITATFTENTDPSPRIASITVTVAGLTPVVVTVTQADASIKTFNLTVFFEGLYTGLSAMHPAMDETSYHWGETIADKLTIDLHSGSNYSTIVYTASNVSLNTNGTATFTLPSSYNGNYYVTIKQRNHILTASAFPVSFSTSTVSYNFDVPGKAYGDNMVLMIDGKYVFYAGDVNQDGIVDGSDLSDIGNLNDLFATGYLSEDVNGDGLVDGSDLSITGNNNDLFVGAVTP